MTFCTTRSGPYQCLHGVNEKGEHSGACEAQAREYTRRTVFVARNGFWWDLCTAKKHGLSKHAYVSVVAGVVIDACIECQKEAAAKRT